MHFSLAKSLAVALLGVGNFAPGLHARPTTDVTLVAREKVEIPQFKGWDYETDKKSGEPDKYTVNYKGHQLNSIEIYKDDKQVVVEAADNGFDTRKDRPKVSLVCMALFQMSGLDKNDLKSLRLEAVVEDGTKKAINEIADKRREKDEDTKEWEQKPGDDSFDKIMETTWGKSAGYLGKEEGAMKVVEKFTVDRIGEDDDPDWTLEFFYKTGLNLPLPAIVGGGISIE